MKLTVIKRDGSKERFDKNKISKVVKASGLSTEKADALADKIETEININGNKKVTTKKIRDLVAKELKKADEYAYGLYVWYENIKDKEYLNK